MNETWNQNTAGCAALCCVGSSVIWWVMIKVETAAARSHERRQQDILGWIMVSGSQAAPSARASYESIMDNKVFYIWYLHPSTIQSFLTEATNVYTIQKYLNVYSQCRYNVKWSATILSRSKTQIRSARHTADTWHVTGDRGQDKTPDPHCVQSSGWGHVPRDLLLLSRPINKHGPFLRQPCDFSKDARQLIFSFTASLFVTIILTTEF